jgi:hypothetical protein
MDRSNLRVEAGLAVVMKALRVVAIALLVFLGLSGIVGAIPMIVYSGGEPWAMPQSLLQHSPFHSYLIPGVILLGCNGLLSLWVLGLTVRKYSKYGWWIGVQGCVLAGWLIAEIAMLRLVVWPHYLYGVVALVLMISGVVLSGSSAATNCSPAARRQ